MTMRVRKRNGDTEPVDVNKIVRAVERCADGLDEVDPLRVATKTISGLYDGATTAELDLLSIQTAAEMTGEEPQYSRLAARLLAGYIDKEVRGQGIASFSQSVSLGHAEGLIGDQTATVVKKNGKFSRAVIRKMKEAKLERIGVEPEELVGKVAAHDIVDPETGDDAGEVLALDREARTLVLKRGPKFKSVPLPEAVIPGDPYRTPDQEDALTRFGRSLLARDHRYPALESILRREPFERVPAASVSLPWQSLVATD